MVILKDKNYNLLTVIEHFGQYFLISSFQLPFEIDKAMFPLEGQGN